MSPTLVSAVHPLPLVLISLAPPLASLVAGLVPTPGFGDDSVALLGVLALVGTTVVPYNLFLGAALARGQGLNEMRFGLVVAVGRRGRERRGR